MKRVFTLLACLILLAGCLCIPVSAESAASSVNLMCTVNSEGDCLATMTVNLRLEEHLDKLFPFPIWKQLGEIHQADKRVPLEKVLSVF